MGERRRAMNERPQSLDADHALARYQPASRRPIADIFRRTADLAVAICVRLGILPDVVSYSSVIASALAAVCFWQSGRWLWLLIPAALLCYVRLWLNMLDGMVALASGKASPRGEIVNEVPDRVSDLLIFVGVAHSGLCLALSGYWAAILALLTAYVGILGQAVGVQREFGGLMSKPWRMVVLHVGAWLLLADRWTWHWTEAWKLTLLDWACGVIILGCIQTIVVRLVRIVAALDKRSVGE
jgi:phosphatidylglycerophosphate synthase